MYDIAATGLPLALALPFGQIENAHRRLTRTVESLSQEAIDFLGSDGNRNSTGTLLAHIALTDWVYLLCIKGEPVTDDPHPYLGAHDDPAGNLMPVVGISAAELLERHTWVMAQVKEYLQGLTDADAARPVSVPWWPEPATLRYVLWHMAGHCMHHIGQIARLKEVFKQA